MEHLIAMHVSTCWHVATGANLLGASSKLAVENNQDEDSDETRQWSPLVQ